MQMKVRLALMMFLEFFIWGGWYVTVVTWLRGALHFSDQQAALVAGTTAIGAIVSPFFIGLIADKLFATQKVLARSARYRSGVALFRFRADGFWSALSARLALCDRVHADARAD